MIHLARAPAADLLSFPRLKLKLAWINQEMAGQIRHQQIRDKILERHNSVRVVGTGNCGKSQ